MIFWQYQRKYRAGSSARPVRYPKNGIINYGKHQDSLQLGEWLPQDIKSKDHQILVG